MSWHEPGCEPSAIPHSNGPSTARSGEWPAWVSTSRCWRALATGTAWAGFVAFLSLSGEPVRHLAPGREDDRKKVQIIIIKLMVKELSGVGFDAKGPDIHVGLMPDLRKRVRYQAIVIAAPTRSVPPRLAGILDGAPEDIIQFAFSSMSCCFICRAVKRSLLYAAP